MEASCQPPASWDKKLGPTLVCEGIEIEDGILKGFCVESDPISNSAKFSDSDTVRSNFSCVGPFAAMWTALDSPWSTTEQCK